MKYLLLLIILFSSIHWGSGQENMVPNPGFEEYYGCDYNYLTTPLDSVIPNWRILQRYPAYFNFECNDSSFLDSQSTTGCCYVVNKPHEGNGFLRLYLEPVEFILPNDTFNYRDLVQVRLLKPLKPEKDYYITYYVTMTYSRFYNFSGYGINFSDTFLVQPIKDTWKLAKRLNIKPQLEVDTLLDLDVGVWKRISHCFSVDKEYSVMSVGMFAPGDSIIKKFDYSVPNDELPGLVSYDDFMLVEIEPEVILEFDRDSICIGECIELSTNHSLIEGEFEWYLPGSQLGESNDSTVTVCYDKAGSYDVGIKIDHCTGHYENYFSKAITVIDSHLNRPLPRDTTICTQEDLVVTIPNEYSVVWDDGDTSNTHIFNRKGEFLYTVTGKYCESTFRMKIDYYDEPYYQNATIYSCTGESTSFLGKVYDFPGHYMDTIKSVFGCDSIYFNIDYYYYPQTQVKIEGDLSFCEGENTRLKIVSPYYSILWNDGSNDNPKLFDNAGIYTIKLTDDNQCNQYDTLNIISHPSPKVIAGDLINIWYYQGIELPVKYNGDIENYAWSNSEYLDCKNCRYPTLQKYFEGVFSVKVTTRHGCTDEGNINVKFKTAIINLPNIIANKAMNPINSSFFLQSDIKLIYDLKIYNRWGNLIFEKDNIPSNNPNAGWQPLGKVNPGVFVYVITFKENDKKKVISGDITVL